MSFSNPSSNHSRSSELPSDLPIPATRSNTDDVLVKVENVSKIFCRDLKKSLLYGLKDSARDLISWGDKARGIRKQERALRAGEFLAVDNVSFELKRGECLGLIGHNGAGKTTLLKMLNGLIKPDTGRIEMRGRVGALIALGAGFNPILTGRENIYVNGSILGLSREEIDSKMAEIIGFSEIGEFIDAPVQSYSSGMQVRLGFAVATATEPDILIVDEVLAVGDFRFRWKCLERIKMLRENGVSIILVSHQAADLMRTCEKGIMLECGKMVSFSSIQKTLHRYESARQDGAREQNGGVNLAGAKIEKVTLLSTDTTDSPGYVVEIELFAERAMTKMRMVLGFFHSNSGPLFHVSSYLDRDWLTLKQGVNRFKVELSGFSLQSGTCTAEVSLRGEYLGDIYDVKQSWNQLAILRDPPNYEGFGINGVIFPNCEWENA